MVPDLLQFQKEHNAVIELPIPQCFYSEYNVAGSELESVLVLDNLKHRGYSSIPFATGLTLAQCEVIIIMENHALHVTTWLNLQTGATDFVKIILGAASSPSLSAMYPCISYPNFKTVATTI